MNFSRFCRRLIAIVAGTVAVVGGLSTPASAASRADPVKPLPVEPADAFHPADGPRITPKPKRAPGSGTRQLAPWSITIGASATQLWPTQWSTITATANQDVGPTPFFISIMEFRAGADGSWAPVAICGSGTTCSVSVTRPDPGYNAYVAYVALYPNGVMPPPTVQAAAPGDGNWTYNVFWRGVGIGLSANVNTVSVGGTVTLTASVGEDIGPSPFWIQIYDRSNGARVAACGSGTSCSAVVSQPLAVLRMYSAVVGFSSETFPPTTVISWSAATYVNWTGSPIRVWLTAPGSASAASGGQVVVGTMTNVDIGPTPYFVLIFNQSTGAFVGSCGYGTSCGVTVPLVPGWNSHVAFVATYSTAFPPGIVQASSNSAHTEYHP